MNNGYLFTKSVFHALFEIYETRHVCLAICNSISILLFWTFTSVILKIHAHQHNIYLFKEGSNLPERYWECKLFFDIDRQERYICPAIDI